MNLGDEYPKAVFKDGGDQLIWGAAVRTRIVDNADEEAEALGSGWRLHPIVSRDPLDHDGDGRKGGSLPKRRGRPPKIQ